MDAPLPSTLDLLIDGPIEVLASAVRSGDVAASEVIEAVVARVEAHAGANVFITTTPERALRRAARRPSGPLAGVPVAVKDLFDTAGVRTTYGSSVFADHVPTGTAAVVRRLMAAGAIVVGKANLHEFAWGVTSQNPHWGTVANPARPGRVAGGSSGGSAAAVAGGLATLALGTDTGGSIRIPAACCDVVGFKPAFGMLSTHGTFPLAPTFDTVGPIARSVRDCAVAYSVLTGREIPRPRLRGVRVGVLAPTGLEDDFADLGARLSEAFLPEGGEGATPVFTVECAITHLPWYPRLRERYGRDLQVKLDRARLVPAIDHHRARLALGEFRERARTEPDVDVLVSPTIAIEPPPVDCWEPDVRVPMTQYTRPFNFLGWPTVAIGNLQIAGRDDAVVLAAALAWEEAHPAHGPTRAW